MTEESASQWVENERLAQLRQVDRERSRLLRQVTEERDPHSYGRPWQAASAWWRTEK